MKGRQIELPARIIIRHLRAMIVAQSQSESLIALELKAYFCQSCHSCGW